MNVLFSPSNISYSRVNAFEGWPSVITARALNLTSAKSSINLLISRFHYSPVTFVSGREPITIGIDFFKETIKKTAIHLNKFPSSSCPTSHYFITDFCK